MAASCSIPLQCQQWLEQLYGLSALAPVDAFLVEGRTVNGPTETLLLRETGEALELGLYLDRRVLDRLEARGGLANFATQSLEDFWTVLEGVSHFVFLGWHAGQDREVSVLDLELQAEIDKFVTAWEFAQQGRLGDLGAALHEQLFDRWRPAAGMSRTLEARYRRANGLAACYCRHLLRRGGNVHERRRELREFFRLPTWRRRERIAMLAA